MRSTISLAAFVLIQAFSQAGEIGFIEDFSFSKDRTEALKKLIPGTEDYYYYHALHYLNTSQFEKIEPLIKPWLERFGQTPRLNEIQTRKALLSYDADARKSLDYLRNNLGLNFNHQKETVGAIPNLPTSLDPKRISRETLLAESLTRWQNLENFEDAALDWLDASKLDAQKLRNYLQRLKRPDVANLPALIEQDFKNPNPVPFGAYPIHQMMTMEQLSELQKIRPALLNQSAFVNASIRHLQPDTDSDWKRNSKEAEKYFDRLWQFVATLAPVHNSLKAHVLYHRLAHDRAQGIYNQERFMIYLNLPRQQPYMALKLMEQEESRKYPAALGSDFSNTTLLPQVGFDEPLVRSFLKHFFLEVNSPKEFEPYINDVYLRHLFAETKIENSLGDVEAWANQLPPEKFKELRERIDIDFGYANKTQFAAADPVVLELSIKNVPSLLVKVFEINTFNFYKTQFSEIETNINLDGLVANSEKTYTFNDGPFRKISKRFEFNEMNKNGVYVVDFIGSGKSSRALIHKGKLRALSTAGPDGQLLNIIDENKKMIKDATVWLGGQEYKSDKDGSIIIPFTASPGQRPIVISSQGFSSLDTINHLPEAYQLQAGIHLDRESMLSLKAAQVVIRPSLKLNGVPVSIKMLEEVRLLITSTDLSGIASTVEVPDFKLFEDRESVHEIRVPARLSNLNITLAAKVKNLSQAKSVDLSTSHSVQINQIERTEKIEDLHFAKFGNDYVIELLGRSGEPRMDRSVSLVIKHRDFKNTIQLALKTDNLGRINLGPLVDIHNVTATGPEGTLHNWALNSDQHTYKQLIHARSGETVTLPHLGTGVTILRSDYSLFAMVGTVIRTDAFALLSIKDGMVEIKGAEAGDYDLYVKRTGEKIRIRIVAGVVEAGFVLGNIRYMRLPLLKPVQIQSVTTDEKDLIIRLKDSSAVARVHIYATRYNPEFSAYNDLGRIRDAELDGIIPGYSESVYLSGRNIGDEYRYVLDRKGQKKYPGNMLERPMLLLNPWVIRSTQTGEQDAVGGEEFQRKSKGEAGAAMPPPNAPVMDAKPGGSAGGFSNLDFLADSSGVLLNLVPDKDGVVKIPRKDLGKHSMINVVAVDPVSTTSRHVSLPEQAASFLDLSFNKGLDPAKHFTQQKQVSILEANTNFKIEDLSGSRFEAYDTLSKVYGLYATLSKNESLKEFSFVTTWPKLKIEEKKKLYSKHSSHEFNFFIYKKDAPFFKEVVQPYLANKKDKTFMDLWLLQSPLDSFLESWHYDRLNVVERVLLAQRIKEQGTKTQRHLDDMLKLIPPNLEQLVMLFDTSIKVDDLSGRDQFGVNAQMEKQDARRELKRAEQAEGKGGDFKGAGAPAPGFAGGGGMLGGIGGSNGTKATPSAAATPMDAAAKKQSMQNLRMKDGRSAGKENESLKELGKSADGADKDMMTDKLARGADESSLYRNRALASTLKQLYLKIDPTMEWAENNYYHLPIQSQISTLVGVTSFWKDYASLDAAKPFLSKHFPEASRNFTEMMFALSVLDLPFESKKAEVKFAAGSMEFKPAAPVIVFHEEVRPAEPLKDQINILVSQNFYKQGDRFREENGEKLDKFISGEFVVHTVYGCQVVVTNPTSSRQKLTVLLQLPVGSIALNNGQFTNSILVNLEPYRTQTIDYFFYFPMAGKFKHFPVHVAKNEKYVASSKPFEFNVFAKPSKLDASSWDYVSQQGTNQEVLDFLERENVRSLNLLKIAFRMKDKVFFASVIKLLQDRHLFNNELWAYGVLHDDVNAIRQYLLNSAKIIAECAGPIDCKILSYNPVASGQYEHLEYKPLVNARAHSLGQARQIVNDRLLEQYQRFLKNLSYRTKLNDADLLAATYYLLLQDRVEEALAYFSQVDPAKIATAMQYDYCRAYLDFYTQEYPRARTLALKYANHPVDRWKNTFAAIINQLDEAEGKDGKVVDPESKEQKQAQLAASEASFDFNIDAKKINLNYQNLTSVKVSYYLMDVELLFSRNPFVAQSGNQFAFIKPNASKNLELIKGQAKASFELPEEYAKKNVLVEISAGAKTISLPYYANAMSVQVIETYGQVKVVDSVTSKPLAKVYVKVYSKTAQGVKFHKDGYTDVRGRFDYATVSTPEKSPIEKFSILILSEQSGAMIKEANPPQQ